MVCFSIFTLSDSFEVSLLLLKVLSYRGDVSKHEGLGHTVFYAHRKQSSFSPVDAEITQLYNPLLRIELRSGDGASLDA